MALRVLIADDQAMVRAGFRMILEAESDIEVVGEAKDGEEALAAARRVRPDVVVMDIRMPRLDGVAVTRRVIEEFVRGKPSDVPPTDALSELTERELEVLCLIARGLSNAEIAEELVIAPATAKTHVRRILMKLNLRDRVQAVVLAYETGLVRPAAS